MLFMQNRGWHGIISIHASKLIQLALTVMVGRISFRADLHGVFVCFLSFAKVRVCLFVPTSS